MLPEPSLPRVLDAAEDAGPVASVTRELGTALWATAVSCLVADLSGRGLVRLTRVDAG